MQLMAGTRSSGYQRSLSLCPDELDFVDPPPKQLLLECPICYGLLYNPHIVSCCGYHFCEHCLERVKEDENPCPMCKEQFTSLRNKALQRDINQLAVLCPNASNKEHRSDDIAESSCDWSGELGLLEGHLEIGHRNGGCKFVTVGCMYGCGHLDKRRDLTSHEVICPKRPFSCDYCGEYESTCEDVIDVHWKECLMYPVECPNLCQLRYLARGQLPKHLKNDCELEVVLCHFSWTGCNLKVQRQKLEEHEQQNIVSHVQKLSLVSSELLNTVEGLKQSNDILQNAVTLLQQQEIETNAKIQHLKDRNTELDKTVNTLQYENDTLKQQVTKMFIESRAEQEVLKRRSFSLESSIGLPPFSFIMENLQEHLQKNIDFFSPSFYSYIGGYRLRIKVTPNGIFFGEGSHLSLTVYIMKGVFDDYLRWPFRGSVTVALLDQLNDTDHKVETITFDKGTSIKASGRVIGRDINEKGLVMYEFFDHSWLKPNSKNRKLYVKEDKILFKVVSVCADQPQASL